MSLSKALTAAAGNAGGEQAIIEDLSFNNFQFNTAGGAGSYNTDSVIPVINIYPSGYDASISFDGTNNGYITIANKTFLDDSLSKWQFECFFRINNNQNSGDMGIIVDQYLNGASGRLLFGWQDNAIVMRVNGGTVYLTSSGSVTMTTNTWYHVCLNYDGTNHRLFVNGTLCGSNSSVPSIYTGLDTSFGGQSGSYLDGYDLDGYLQAIHVQWNPSTVRTSSFTPPTTITTGSGTELLIVASAT